MRVKIHGGTAKGDEDLCVTCRHAMIRKGQQGSSFVHCGYFDRTWNDPTSECNSYLDKRTPHYQELIDIAWKITADPKGKIGFQAPSKEEKQSRVIHILDE
jgi:hypothetical protein